MRQTFFADNTLPSVLQLIAEAVAFLKGGKLSPRSIFLSEFVLEEMLTNAVKYAFDDTRIHRIEVTTEVSEGKVRLELRDDGHYFDPLQAPPPPKGLPVQRQTIGGRGINLVKNFVRDLDYRRQGEWNVLTLSFSASAGAPTPGSFR